MSYQDSGGTGGQQEIITEKKLEEPERYRVLMHNDDYTSMDFVVWILRTIFHKNPVEARSIMLEVHHNGIGMCGIYTREIAETKVTQVLRHARQEGFPLRCTKEKV